MDIFQKAAKQKWRLQTKLGALTVEQLYDLPLVSSRKLSLNELAIAEDAKLATGTKSFVSDDVESSKNYEAKFSLELIVAVIKDKEADAKANAELIEKSKRNAMIDGLIQAKEHNKLAEMSIEDLKKLRG